jgi:aspartate kinase
VEQIVDENPERRFIVPSAPGKRTPKDKKITDLLYAWHSLLKEDLDCSQPRGIIIERLNGIASDLGIDFDATPHLDDIERESREHDEPDFMASRGEYLNGLLMAEFLNAEFVDPSDYIRFSEEGQFDPASYDLLRERLQGDGRFVVPGFYGRLPNGRIKTFSRGGSDVTGSIVARATRSHLYENWTDVSGFLMADPAIVPNALRIDEITYGELRELSYMGARVLHDEAIFPVREPGIPIHIRNTHSPEDPGTRILPIREVRGVICGIAGRAGFTMVNIEKTLMNKERGFGRRVLGVLEDHGVSIEHVPTGIDTMSVIVEDEEMSNHGPAVLKDIERICQPDRVTLTHDLAIIATVGLGMAGHVGVAARLFGALAQAEVNVRVIDQGSSENNIIVGVSTEHLGPAVRAIYEAFSDAVVEGGAPAMGGA